MAHRNIKNSGANEPCNITSISTCKLLSAYGPSIHFTRLRSMFLAPDAVHICTDCTEHWLKQQNPHSLREWMESHYDIRSSELFLFWNGLRYAFLLHLQSSFSQCLYKLPVRCPVSYPLPFGISSHTLSFLKWELRYLKRFFPLFQLLLGWQWIVLLHVSLNSINKSR